MRSAMHSSNLEGNLDGLPSSQATSLPRKSHHDPAYKRDCGRGGDSLRGRQVGLAKCM